jgi:hypothetical protein
MTLRDQPIERTCCASLRCSWLDRSRRLLLYLLCPALCFAADYVYAIRDGGYAIGHGPAYFNRPLFCTHETSRLLQR